MDTLNTSNTSDLALVPPVEIWTTGNILFLIFAILLMAITIVGNGLIIAAWFVYKPLQTPSNLLLVSLAIPDFLLGFFSMPLNSVVIIANNWYFGPVMCQLWTTTNIIFGFVSSNHLVLIALDRYHILTYQITYLQRRNYRSALTSIGFLWILGICIASPYIFDWEGSVHYYSKHATVWVCFFKQDTIHILSPILSIRLIPACLMIYFYAKIYTGIKERLRKNLKGKSQVGLTRGNGSKLETVLDTSTSNGQTTQVIVNLDSQEKSLTDDGQDPIPQTKSPNEELAKDRLTICIKKERRAARTLGILIACFVFLWFPFLTVSILKAIFGITASPSVFLSFAVFGWINSAVNPIIYAIHNKDFKIAFKRMGLPVKVS